MRRKYAIIFALINRLLGQQRLQARRLSLLLTGVLLMIAGSAHAVTIPFTGVFEPHEDDKSRGDATVRFSLEQESIVSLTYIPFCKNNNNASMKLYNEWGETPEGWTNLKDYPQPWGPIPLAAGNWTIMLECTGEQFDREEEPPNTYIPTPYKLIYTKELGQSQFAKDSESEPVAPITNPITITKGISFSGWIGYMGYRAIALTGDDYYQFGNDGVDNYYVRLAEGTRIKIKLEYDTSLINALLSSGRDIGFNSFLIKNGNPNNYLPYDVVNDFQNMWQFSGDTSKEFTIPQDGTYLFRVFCGSGPNSAGFRFFPKTNYGGYRMSVIVNEGDPIPSIDIGYTNLSTTYRDPVSREYVTVDNLFVPGETSRLRIMVSSNTAQQIELVAGLSLKTGSTYGPINPIGLGTCNVSSGLNVCQIDATLDKNSQGVLRGKLVIVGYIDGHKADQQQQPVFIYDENSLSVIGPALDLLLMGD